MAYYDNSFCVGACLKGLGSLHFTSHFDIVFPQKITYKLFLGEKKIRKFYCRLLNTVAIAHLGSKGDPFAPHPWVRR